MADNINISGECTERYATGISDITDYFVKAELVHSDDKSTIRANANGKTAYTESQTALELFGSCLEQETKNMRELGAEFTQYDEMLAELCELGNGVPSIILGE